MCAIAPLLLIYICDSRFELFPSWRDLYHFHGALNITFNDGKKHEDLSKVQVCALFIVDYLCYS